MDSGKPAFQLFVEANQALLSCYNNITPDDYKKMSEAQREGACGSQKEKVRALLSSNQLVMSNLIRERVEILKRLGANEKIVIRD